MWGAEYETFKDSKSESALADKLDRWSRRKVQKETSAESAFEQTFFQEIWGYAQSGQFLRTSNRDAPLKPQTYRS